MIPEQQEITRVVRHLVDVHVRSECAIRPHFFLAGPSGSGKSHIVQTVADEMDVAFFEINAAQLTKEGISGNSLSKALSPLRQSWDRPTIVFVDTVEEYRAHRDAQVGRTNAVHAIIEDELPMPTRRINVGAIGHIGRDKTQLTAVLSKMDFAAIEARIAGHLSGKQAGTILVDSLAILDQMDNPMDKLVERLKKAEVPEPMPIEYRTRRSKGDKHRNRRHRWS